jgi:hypothetical protein
MRATRSTPTSRRGYKKLSSAPLLFILADAQSFPLATLASLFPRRRDATAGHEANGFGRSYIHEWEARAL